MIINPREVLEKGFLVAQEGCLPLDPEKQMQQAGIDIRINRIFCIAVPLFRITNTEKPNFRELYTEKEPDSDNLIRLSKGEAYFVDSMEYCKVPKDATAFVLHRSTFNRSGIFVTGSVYDPSFEGNVGATMYVHNSVEIEVGTRFAQILFMSASAAQEYQGGYQKQKGHLS